MSEINQVEKPIVTNSTPFKTFRFFSNTLFGIIIRAAQFLITIIVLGLAGNSVNKYVTGGSMGYTVFTAVISLLYLIIIGALTFFISNVLLIGVVLIWELLITIFWFTSFIAIAATHGSDNCKYYVTYGYYYYGVDSSACKASKAAIAFAAINFVLFVISLLSLGFTSLSNIGINQLFNTKTTLNKPVMAVTSVDSVTTPTSNDLETNIPPAEESTQQKPVTEVEHGSVSPAVTP